MREAVWILFAFALAALLLIGALDFQAREHAHERELLEAGYCQAIGGWRREPCDRFQ